MKYTKYTMLLITSFILAACTVLMPWQAVSTTPEKVAEGLFRGPRPDFFEVRDTSLGIGAIISLEEGPNVVLQKEKDYVESHGMTFINLPMSETVAPTPDYLRRIAAIIEANRPQHVYVHCRRGIDRTGYAIAAWQILYSGWSFDRAYKGILAHGHSELYFVSWKASLKEVTYQRD